MTGPLHVSLGEKNFECLHCKIVYDLGMTHEEYFEKRRGKRMMRKIELDSEGFSRKWSGTYIAHDGNVIRDDGHGHPHITCSECGRINVFGRASPQEFDEDDYEIVMQVLGRSETDLRFLKEKEDGKRSRDPRMGRPEDPAKEGLAGDLRAAGSEAPGGLSGEGE